MNFIVCVVKTGTFMGGHRSRPYEVEVYFYVAQTEQIQTGDS